MSVCLFIYLSACVSQKPHVQFSRNFLYILIVAVAWSFDDNAIRYVLPVLWMTLLMFVHSRPGKGNASRAYTRSYSPGTDCSGRSLMSKIALFSDCCRPNGRLYEVVWKIITQCKFSCNTEQMAIFTACSELRKVLFLALSVTFLFMYEISWELLNGFAPNSDGRRFRSLARTSMKVKVKGERSRSPGTKTVFFGTFGGLRAVYVW